MREMFALGATLAFILAGAIVGGRLILTARRSGELAGLYLGLALFSIGGLAYPLLIAGDGADSESKRALAALGSLLICFGWCNLWLFTWTTFHRDGAWARALSLVAIGATVFFTAWRVLRLLLGDPATLRAPSVDGIGSQFLALCLYVWTAVESFRYYAMLRRRARLGLADPAVVNRFLLWGVMGIFSFVSLVVPFAGAFHQTADFVTVSRLVTGFAGTVCAVVLYLAFMPPRSYLDWIRRRAALAS